ncbi:hypothetical protein CTI12_AA570550 [Artemisia annua]|uniref:Uncharacterized protein n=1 Tax=Artemisia annua TaxID=35608 RepID=A0A2U1KSM5_ARTAN|nr:hypothetical protein CTI12_AA570550 [Artemisia annua]
MAFNQRWSEEGNTGSQPNTSSANEFAAISDLEREAGEMMVIRTLKRYARTILTPLIHQIVSFLNLCWVCLSELLIAS